VTLTHLNLFQDADHQPFRWDGGPAAALLVHGFPGTPAELRPLAAALHRQGWSVQGLLLPGFGPQIHTLFERNHTEWVGAVTTALARLRQEHGPVLLVGYSMGAALALQVAASHPPDGLILLAPFWQLGSWWQQLVGALLKPFFRQMRPFKKANFSDPNVRRGVSNFMSQVDLDDPAVQQTLRELQIPTRIFEQLHRVGQQAYRVAPQVAGEILMVQGLEDEVVPRRRTHRLLQQLPGPLHYVEVAAGHDLVRPEEPAWDQVEQAVLIFAQTVAASQGAQ